MLPNVMRVYIRQRINEEAKGIGVTLLPSERAYIYERAINDVARAVDETVEESFKLLHYNRANPLPPTDQTTS